MLSKLLPFAALGFLTAAPVFVAASPAAETAVAFHARATVSHAELAENTAKGLATPIGIASASTGACEVRCVLATTDSPSSDHLMCDYGESRSVVTGFEVVATWSEAGVQFEPTEQLSLQSCH